MNPMIRYGEIALRQREMMKQAENERLARMAHGHAPSPLLFQVGRQLIALGERLQNSARPMPEQHYEPRMAVR